MCLKLSKEKVKDTIVLRERVRAVEVKIEGISGRMDRFEDYCKETQDIYRESFGDLNARIEKFLINEVHDLEIAIEDARNQQRQPLSSWDWTKIVIAIITVVGSIIIALAQYKVI